MIKDVIEKVKSGELTIPKSDDGRTMNIRSITASDI